MPEALMKKRIEINTPHTVSPSLPSSCTTRLISPGEQFPGHFLFFTVLKLQIPFRCRRLLQPLPYCRFDIACDRSPFPQIVFRSSSPSYYICNLSSSSST